MSRALWAVVEAHRAANAHDLPGNAHGGRPGDEQHCALLATLEERRADLRRAEEISEARGGVVAAARERPRLPPEWRKPRTSGDPRAPTEAESAHQRAVLAGLAADVGAELCRRRVTGDHPATWAALARVLGIGPATLSRANAAPAKARYVRPATLLRWKRAARAWIAGEDPTTTE